jgi:hypothetical protein
MKKMIKRFMCKINRVGASLRSWFGEREKRREARKEIVKLKKKLDKITKGVWTAEKIEHLLRSHLSKDWRFIDKENTSSFKKGSS